MIREALSSLARNQSLGGLLSRAPIARDVVKRVVGGDTIEAALVVAGELADRGYVVSLERAAPAVVTLDEADTVLAEYRQLLDAVAASGLAQVCEVAVVPESLEPDGSVEDGLGRMTELARHAARRRVPLMAGAAPAADTGTAIAWAQALEAEGLELGLTLPAALHRTEQDCARLADGRIRLVKGGHRGLSSIAFQQPAEVDKAYIRSAKALLRGTGEPSFATHDPRIVEILQTLVTRYDRARQSYEFTFFMGRQEGLQERLLASGERVRIYVPYGPEWFERLVGGLSEQSSSVSSALRSLLPGSS